jgi:acetyl-CoA carboxylase beta subunit
MKCNYCDFVWEDEEEYGKHLNAAHTKCFHCSTVFNNDEFDDDYAICGKCREKESEE